MTEFLLKQESKQWSVICKKDGDSNSKQFNPKKQEKTEVKKQAVLTFCFSKHELICLQIKLWAGKTELCLRSAAWSRHCWWLTACRGPFRTSLKFWWCFSLYLCKNIKNCLQTFPSTSCLSLRELKWRWQRPLCGPSASSTDQQQSELLYEAKIFNLNLFGLSDVQICCFSLCFQGETCFLTRCNSTVCSWL